MPTPEATPWNATEESLLDEAGSLGELLEQLYERAFPRLIDPPAWGRLATYARELPVTLAALPFGFEARLHNLDARADLGVMVAKGTRTETFFRERASAEGADGHAAGIVRLLDKMEQEDGSLQRLVGPKVGLEYDIDDNPQGTQVYPGIFLFPQGALPGGCGDTGLANLDLALDGLLTATGWAPDRDAAHQARQMYQALTPEMHLQSLGAFPARSRDLRLGLANIRTPGQLTTLLQRVGWNGHYPLVDAIASQLEERNASDLTAHLDTGKGGISTRLGLSCFIKKTQWLQEQDTQLQANLFDGLRALGCAAEEKLSALDQTPLGRETLLMKSGAYTFMRGISHIKLTLVGERITEAKAYIYMLLLAARKPPA